jgi:hypothetical protein
LYLINRDIYPQRSVNMAQHNDSQINGLSWEIRVPLITNRLIIGATAKIFGFSILLVCCLISLVLASQGDFRLIPKVLLLISITGISLFVLALLLMVIVFKNRWQYHYTINNKGIVCETIDKKLKTANRLAIGAGILLGSPRTVGAGIIGKGQEIQNVSWKGKFRAEYTPESNIIIIRNAWRKLMIIYCLSENYNEAVNICKVMMEKHSTEKQLPQKSFIPKYILYSIVNIVCSLPLFFMADPFHLPLWIPMVLLCFSMATLWLIEVFGYVVFGSALLAVIFIAVDAFTVVDSYIHPGESFQRWTIFSGDDWALLFLGATSLFILCWFAFMGIRGRIIAVLTSDMSDMEG